VIIVDTSAWVDHFRYNDPEISALILQGEIALHPYVFGELLLGGFPTAGEAAAQMHVLMQPPVASTREAAAFITWAKLDGTGIGYVDCHLLISAKLNLNGCILTRDKKLQAQAERLGVAYSS
jgi:predicted nucleic acid-binding protein